MISKILVPTDGSKTAQKAARYAVDLAKQLKASIIILSVFDWSSFMSRASSDAFVTPRELESMESSLKGSCQETCRSGKETVR